MMKSLIILSILLAACTTLRFKDGDSEFFRTSVGTQLQITKLSVTTDAKNNRTIEMHGYTSDQVEALKAVAEGVAKGLKTP